MVPKQDLAVVILTRNEAQMLPGCLRSLVGWATCAVVWDSGSDDHTVALAHAAGALVVQRPFDDYARQRQSVLDSLAARWIFFVDADERITPALAREIDHVLAQAKIGTGESAQVGFWVPRRNFIVGHEMRGGGFTPDYQLRLLRRDRAQYDLSREVHEVVHLKGSAGYLSEPLIHYNYSNWAQFHRKQATYAAYEAHILEAQGHPVRPHNLILQPLREFHRRFFALQGWRDGLHGLGLALFLAWYYGFLPYWLRLRG